MVKSGVQAILVKVAALGLDPAKHLGQNIADVAPHLLRMVYSNHMCEKTFLTY
jgi:diphthine-ammonia ligase